MEEFQECAGNLKAIVINLKDDVQHGKISEAAAIQRLGAIKFRAKLAKKEFRETYQKATALFG